MNKILTKNLPLPTIAIVGCGAIAEQFYLPALLNNLNKINDLILVENEPNRLKQMADRFQVKSCTTDYKDILDSADGVIIALPHHLHYSIASDILTSGINVLCEKPLADTFVEASKLVALAKEHDVVLAVNHTRRIFPSSIKVKQLLAENIIGDILSIEFLEGGEFSWPTASGFYFDSKLSKKGVMFDLGSHVFDLICWWLDGKHEIISSENDSFGGCESAASVKFKYKKCSGEIRLSRLARLPNRFKIKCERGSIEGGVYDSQTITLTTTHPNKTMKINAAKNKTVALANDIVLNLLEVINNKTSPLISANEVLDSIEVLEEAYSKAKRFVMPWYDLKETTDAK